MELDIGKTGNIGNNLTPMIPIIFVLLVTDYWLLATETGLSP